MTTDSRGVDDSPRMASAGPTTESCDVCGTIIEPAPGESRFEAVVAHFEAVHVGE